MAGACRDENDEDGTKGDARFTTKSHLYDALASALNFHSMNFPMVERFLRLFLGHSDINAYLMKLGDKRDGGFRAGERDWLKERLRKMLSPI